MTNKIMITDSMTNEEIISLLEEDFVFVKHKLEELYPKYLKLAKKYSHRKERVNFKPVSYKSAKGFNYVFRCYKRDVNDKDKLKVGCENYIWYVKERGIYAIREIDSASVDGYELIRCIYTPHFFDRYRERFLKDLSIPKLEVIEKFMLSNDKYMSKGIPSEKYPNSSWSLCKDGLCLCTQINNSLYEGKTFVTFDMAVGGERQEFIDYMKRMNTVLKFELDLPKEDFEEFTQD